MRAKFLHFADCHLGFRQYDNKERLYDFAKSFLSVIDRAVQEKVDFVLLAGDLFQKRAVDALTLNQAVNGLERLKAAGIPCIAVEGNHERAYYVDSIGWMEFLDQRGLLMLLNIPFENGKPVLQPYDRRRKGAYVEPVAGLRIYGLRYYGAATAAAIAQIAETLAEAPADGVQYTAFMAHTGMEGVLDGASGGLSYRQWAMLRPHVDYLALGHVHKPFEAEGWIHNPGSLESCSIVEADWRERGYYLVTVNTEAAREGEPKHSAALHRPDVRREVVRLSMKVDEHATPDLLCAECERFLQRKARDYAADALDEQSRPLVELQLTGVLPFDRAGLDIERIRAAVVDAFRPLLPLVKDLTRSASFAVEAQEGASRADVERQVLRDLLARDRRYQEDAEEWTQTVLTLKKHALDGLSPDAIIDELAHRMDEIAAHAAEQAPNADPIA